MEELREYLTYMKQIGFLGLDLPQNPFQRQLAKPTSSASRPQSMSVRSPQPVMPYAPAANRPPSPPSPTPNSYPSAVRGPAPSSPVPVPPKGSVQPPAPAARSAPMAGLFSLMDRVHVVSPAEEVRRKAEAIVGQDKVEMLRQLYRAFQNCESCALGTTRTRFVFGEGDPNAELMFVGEGPGFEEDQSGRPFVGNAGQLLDKIIEAMGYLRKDVFIANVVKCRPPDNRTPIVDESNTCSPILIRQIQIVQPKIIVALGGTALKFFAGMDASPTRMRGKYMQWREFSVMPTFHPAYVLRNPAAKRDVWEDMKKVMASLGKAPRGRE